MGTTTREHIIAIEQKAVDRAYDCYAARLAELTSNSLALASASGKDSVANRIDGERRADAYGGLGKESLVISRVDVQEKPGDEPETWYIGRRGVRDATTGDPVVLLWTSPQAKKWAEALPTAPGEVLLRRKLRCTQRTVQDYFDEIATTISAPQPASKAAGQPATETAPPATVPRQRGGRRAPVPTPAQMASQRRKKEAVGPDDFLLRELQRSRGGRMRDIVETIRRDQMALVTDSPSDILIVQGGPGTGKSAVGLHRVTWLVHNKHFPAQDVLVIAPHQRFLDYVGQVLPALGVRNVNAVQLTRLWDGEILGEDTPRARLVKSDDRMAAVLRRRVENEHRPEAIDDLTTPPSYEGGEAELTVTAGRTTLRIPRSELHALLDQVQGGGGAYRTRRERLEDASSRAQLPTHDRGLKLTAAFDALLTDAGLKLLTTGIQTPRRNSLGWLPGPHIPEARASSQHPTPAAQRRSRHRHRKPHPAPPLGMHAMEPGHQTS
ncbi:hypothetical protein ACFOSC_00890 [Streptantibioticus rubrisoli]|uniref:hypothetical protein n=1 Tax=Streptantibioticus rubrisoli TaxID=1387313 RepID=UPI00361A87DF